MVVAFYALVDAGSVNVETIVRAFVFIGALLAVFGVIGFVIQYANDLALKQAVLGTLSAREWLPKWYRPEVFYHPNLLAAAMNLALPFALALAVHARSRTERVLTAMAFGLCLVVLDMTDSRGAWLGFMVALPAFVILSMPARPRAGLGQGQTVGRRAQSALRSHAGCSHFLADSCWRRWLWCARPGCFAPRPDRASTWFTPRST